MFTTDSTLLHVRFDGRSDDLELADLNLAPNVTDGDLRAALAARYDCAPGELDDYVIVREPRAIIVRPVAIYG